MDKTKDDYYCMTCQNLACKNIADGSSCDQQGRSNNNYISCNQCRSGMCKGKPDVTGCGYDNFVDPLTGMELHTLDCNVCKTDLLGKSSCIADKANVGKNCDPDGRGTKGSDCSRCDSMGYCSWISQSDGIVECQGKGKCNACNLGLCKPYALNQPCNDLGFVCNVCTAEGTCQNNPGGPCRLGSPRDSLCGTCNDHGTCDEKIGATCEDPTKGEDPSCFKCVIGSCMPGGFCGWGQDVMCKTCDANNFCTQFVPYGEKCMLDGTDIRCDGGGRCVIGLI